MRNMKFPKLNKPLWINKPTQNTWKQILETIGVIRVEIQIHVPENQMPFLPINYKKTQYRPRQATVKGTWTTQELRYATQQKQITILNIEWCEIYEETHNPFKTYINKLETIEMNEPDKKPVIKILRTNLS